MLLNSVFFGLTQVAKSVIGFFGKDDQQIESEILGLPKVEPLSVSMQNNEKAEVWKNLPFDGRKVEISSDGNIRVEVSKNSTWHARDDGWIYPSKSFNKSAKYWYTFFNVNGQKKALNLTFAVLELFVSPKPNYISKKAPNKVFFKDGNPKNIHFENLRWLTLDEIKKVEKGQVDEFGEPVEAHPNSEDIYWVPVPGYEGIYEVSNYGYVRSLDREIVNSAGKKQKFKGKVLKRYVISSGHLGHTLSNAGKNKECPLSAIMVATFMKDKIETGRSWRLKHKDGHNGNYHIDNLEIEYL